MPFSETVCYISCKELMESLPLEMMQLGLHYRFHLWMPETQVTSYRDYLLRVRPRFSCWWIQTLNCQGTSHFRLVLTGFDRHVVLWMHFGLYFLPKTVATLRSQNFLGFPLLPVLIFVIIKYFHSYEGPDVDMEPALAINGPHGSVPRGVRMNCWWKKMPEKMAWLGNIP